MIQIFDDVVSKKYQDEIERTLLSPEFSWHFNPSMTTADEESKNYGFFHGLIRMMPQVTHGNLIGQKPDYFWLNFFYPLIYEAAEKADLRVNQVFCGRAFMQMPSTSKHDHDLFHVDAPHPHFVFLYYVNDSDGDTVILSKKNLSNESPVFADIPEDSVVERVSPKKGRMVVFDGTRFHAAGIPKNNPRIVLNFDVTCLTNED